MKIAPTNVHKNVLPLQDSLRIDGMEAEDEVLTVTLTETAAVACYPTCEMPSSRIHSHHQRQPADLPWGTRALRLILRVRRFRCPVPDCSRRIFTERFPHLLRPHARRTARAQEVVRAVALALGGEAGARLVPARWRPWEIRDGVRVRVVWEPSTREIVTAFPDPGTVQMACQSLNIRLNER